MTSLTYPRACVLVAEANDDVRNLVVEVLRRDGYQTCEAGSHHEIADRLRCRFRLALIQYELDHGLVRYLARHGVPVIGLVAGPDGQSMLDDGAREVLSKPFDAPSLLAAVRRALG